MLEIPRIQSKVNDLEFTVDSHVNHYQEAKGSAPESWRVCTRSLKTDTQGKGEQWSSSEGDTSFFPLFIPLRLQVYWLVPLTFKVGLLSSVNSFSNTHNYANPISWVFLTQTDTTVNYHTDCLYNELLLSNKYNKLLVLLTQMNLKALHSTKTDIKSISPMIQFI